MKKLFFVFCMMFISMASFAQQGKTTVGVHADYLIDDPNNFGIGANVGYEFLNNVRAVAGFDYLFKKDFISYWNAEFNAEYLFRLGEKFSIYPLAGIDLFGISVEHGGNDSKLGLNLGAGVEFDVASGVALKAEYTYKTQWDGISQLRFGVVIPF